MKCAFQSKEKQKRSLECKVTINFIQMNKDNVTIARSFSPYFNQSSSGFPYQFNRKINV